MKAEGETAVMNQESRSGSGVHYFCPPAIGYNSVTRPQLTIKEAGNFIQLYAQQEEGEVWGSPG